MKIRRTVVSQSCDKRTNERTDERGQTHRSLRSTNGDQKSSSVRFFGPSQGILKKKIMKIRRTVVSQTPPDGRTNGRTDEAKIIGPFGLRPGTN